VSIVLAASYKPRVSRPPASEPFCLRCEVTTDLHAVEVKNTAWWFRGRLCDACYRELERRRQQWMAQPHAEPGSLRAVRLAGGLSVREPARRTGLSASMISRVERGKRSRAGTATPNA
jgi:helix-turn-helix protein